MSYRRRRIVREEPVEKPVLGYWQEVRGRVLTINESDYITHMTLESSTIQHIGIPTHALQSMKILEGMTVAILRTDRGYKVRKIIADT